MSIIITCLLFILGLILIIKGGDWFIDAASWIAKTTGMPEVLIGATIVSLGTTFPELMVSTTASIQGHGEMAIGNAIGSTICNIGLILGFCNIISPSKINSRIYTIKSFMMLCYAAVLMVMVLDGKIGKVDTILLLVGVIIYILVNYLEVNIKKTTLKRRGTYKHEKISLKEGCFNGLKFIAGACVIVVGARLLVDHGIVIASLLKVPQFIISLTLIALGTSLPELVTSVTALLKGYRNLAVGNIIGANILNMTMVIGVSSIFGEITVPNQIIRLDLPFSLMLMVVLTYPSIITWKINRIHASILLFLYILYIFLVF
ncbi:MAG: hypothetical protein CVV02_01005 [Firmicutes bacterium HGW-Firmicutes-7]|nr:MAG: hypothetical protein CVV02_01005 [Firmicutes bacterium HGW-Firmicutes-7]